MTAPQRGSASFLVLGLCGLVLAALPLVAHLVAGLEAAGRAEAASEAAALGAAWALAARLPLPDPPPPREGRPEDEWAEEVRRRTEAWSARVRRAVEDGRDQSRRSAGAWAARYRGHLAGFDLQPRGDHRWRLAVRVRVGAHPFLPGELWGRSQSVATVRLTPSGWGVELEGTQP